MEPTPETKKAAAEREHQKESVRPLRHGPTSQNVEPHEAHQTPEDLLEEESMESFPAGDPPSHSEAHS